MVISLGGGLNHTHTQTPRARGGGAAGRSTGRLQEAEIEIGVEQTGQRPGLERSLYSCTLHSRLWPVSFSKSTFFPICCWKGFYQKLDPLIGVADGPPKSAQSPALGLSGVLGVPCRAEPPPMSPEQGGTSGLSAPVALLLSPPSGAVPDGGGSPPAPSLLGSRLGMGCPVLIWGES